MQSFNSSFTKLLTSRALDMCDKLDLNAMVRHKVTALIEGILNIEYQVRLLRNRHADVLMLCALFSACKLTKVPISWIQLLPCYEKQPQATRDTTMLIYVEDGHDQIDIAKFYNAIFVPTVGNILKPGENLNTEPAGLEMFSPLRKRTEATQTVVRNPVPNNGRTNRVLGASTRTLFPLSKLSSHSTTM
ncbi:cyclin-like protein [Obelidium mucronatum]|nr:cyclin-like protein [Obelidium mucronatum]